MEALEEHSMYAESGESMTNSLTGTSLLDFRERRFSISSLQILDENAALDEVLEPSLDAGQLSRLYRAMVLARAVDDRLLKLQRQGRIGTFPPSTGQEASACAPTLAMTDKDWFVGSFRELGGRLMRGEPVVNVFLYYNGYEEGNAFPGGERTLPVSIIIASQMLHAVGIAYAMKIRGEADSAVVCFLGDGGTSEGDFHEALNFASLWQVPVVFIIQNNQWAISLPRRKQTRSQTLAQKAIAYDIPGVQVDGNDALAMYQAAKEALDRARAGHGPTLIEAVTYRLRMHTTADDPGKYRSEEEVHLWEKRDPLPRFRAYLQRKDLWNDEKQAQLEAEVKQQIEEAVKAFESHTDFRPDAPFDHVFGTRHAVIEQQRAEFLDNLKRETSDA
jgi:pyruvate dehydrogenase E1 component alpha subunit